MDFDNVDDHLKFSKIGSESTDKLLEKGNFEMKEKEMIAKISDNQTESNIYDQTERKHFDYDTLNRDLADIEERLRQTRISWRKDIRMTTEDFSDAILKVDGVRKSFSLLDIDKRTYSSASSIGDMEKLDGEKRACESPAISDGLLKWDYGADIGLDQNDSDDMEPITWPVTAEEAQKNERDAINRRMKQSLSQGSFLASPDPEDKRNLINRFSEELKSKRGSSSHSLFNHRQYSSISILSEGKYDDISARQIMEQAEAAEKRLRERLESVKALHLNGKNISRDLIEKKDEYPSKENVSVSNQPLSRKLSDQSSKLEQTNEIKDTIKSPQNYLTEEITTEINKSTVADDRSRSPISVNNTGRTTTIESTHTFSDYGKAPMFQPDAYGSRTDYFLNNNVSNMYSKKSRDKSVERCRSVCGIAPDLETISSRETLHVTDEKKDNSLVSAYGHHEEEFNKENTPMDQVKFTNKVTIDNKKDDSLQVKWDRFKLMRKDDEYEPLYEKTTVRTAAQYNPQNSHRQLSSATTFTTITNVSPRYDSFATETFKTPLKGNLHTDFIPNHYEAAAEETKNKIPSGKIPPTDEDHRREYQRFDSNQYINSRSRPGRRIVGGSGGGNDDNDDDDISQTEKRRIRHSGDLKKIKRKFGSGQLDCETTASELEHDDAVNHRQRGNYRKDQSQRLSRMLSDMSRRGVKEESIIDVSCHSDSSSVDTVQLMNRMSNLLGKQKTVASRKNDSEMHTKVKRHRKPSGDSTNYSNKIPSNKMTKITESEDGMLMLKHLMLKQKVKWLADCAREEARRRKVKKLQKLIDMYEQGDNIIVPSDLETDTATLMGSERGSQNDLDTQSESYAQENKIIQVDCNQRSVNAKTHHKNVSKPHSFRQQYYDSRQNNVKKLPKRQHKSYPVSEAWHIPLREDFSNYEGDVNASNWNEDQYISRQKRMPQRYRSPCSRAESIQERPVNLSGKERVRIKYELELARQRNANECQKDIRHSKTGKTKVNGGGLAWTIGNDCDFENKELDPNVEDNHQGKSNVKSALQMSFENSMENFISRSRQRQKRIKLASDERRYESQMTFERAKLFATNSGMNSVPKRRANTKPDPLSATDKVKSKSMLKRGLSSKENLYKPRRRKFSKAEMKIQSARKYDTLPEVQAKYIDERRKARIQNNRMRMQLYGEKILQSVLRNRGPWISESR